MTRKPQIKSLYSKLPAKLIVIPLMILSNIIISFEILTTANQLNFQSSLSVVKDSETMVTKWFKTRLYWITEEDSEII